MDPRFALHPTHVVDHSGRLLPPGAAFAGGHSPAFVHPLQGRYTLFDQTQLVGEVAIPARAASGQAYFHTDHLQPGTTVLQELPNPDVAGAGYGLGPVNLGYRNVALTPLNNLQVAEIGPSAGVQSVFVPSYPDISGFGHGYGNSAPVYVYQPYPQAQIHADPALLPLSSAVSRQQLFLDRPLEQEYGSLDQSNPALRARRIEVDKRRKLERGRVLDKRRELQRRPDVEKALLKKKAYSGEEVHGGKLKGNTWCSICKVECQSPHVFQNHIEGKKHKLKLEAAKETRGELKKKSEEVIKEEVKSGKEKEVEVGLNRQQTVKSAKTEKSIRKRLRRAEQRRALAAKRREEKAEKDGTADEAINKALVEIGKVGADFTVDRVYNELKTGKVLGDLDAEKAFEVEKVNGKIEVEADIPIGEVEGDADVTKMMILESVQFESMDTQNKVQKAEEAFEEKVRHDKIESVKAIDDIDSEEGKYVAEVDLPTSQKKDVLGKRSREISSLSPTATPQKTSPVKSKKTNVGSPLQSETVRCEVCAVTCRNATVYKSHLKGEKHAERLKKSLGSKGTPAKVRKTVGKEATAGILNVEIALDCPVSAGSI